MANFCDLPNELLEKVACMIFEDEPDRPWHKRKRQLGYRLICSRFVLPITVQLLSNSPVVLGRHTRPQACQYVYLCEKPEVGPLITNLCIEAHTTLKDFRDYGRRTYLTSVYSHQQMERLLKACPKLRNLSISIEDAPHQYWCQSDLPMQPSLSILTLRSEAMLFLLPKFLVISPRLRELVLGGFTSESGMLYNDPASFGYLQLQRREQLFAIIGQTIPKTLQRLTVMNADSDLGTSLLEHLPWSVAALSISLGHLPRPTHNGNATARGSFLARVLSRPSLMQHLKHFELLAVAVGSANAGLNSAKRLRELVEPAYDAEGIRQVGLVWIRECWFIGARMAGPVRSLQAMRKSYRTQKRRRYSAEPTTTSTSRLG